MAFANPRHDNVQYQFELIQLGDGDKQITEKIVAGMSNTSDFVLKKEDHTLGNLLSDTLKKDPHVLMAGYKVAHPDVPEVLIRIQTDGTLTPKEALAKVCRELFELCGKVGGEFEKELLIRQFADRKAKAAAAE